MYRLANKEDGVEVIKVTDVAITEKLKKTIMSFWDSKNDFFPAPQPVSLDRKSIHKLYQDEYLVCAKSDGMRFIMIHYEGVTYMTDRAFKFSIVNQHFKKELLYSTDNNCGFIVDGELVKFKSSNKWQYVVHDCISMAGTSVFNQSFPKRYEQIHRLVNEIWIPDRSDFKVSEKQFYPFSDLSVLKKRIDEGSIDHEVDGIIFTPKYKKIGSNTQYDLFKWKPRNLHTFDFKIIISEEGVTAYVNKNGVHIPYARAPKNTADETIFLNHLHKNCPDFTNGSIIECEYDDVLIAYRPIKMRLDKIHPNSLFTIEKTLLNIRENIKIEELIKH